MICKGCHQGCVRRGWLFSSSSRSARDLCAVSRNGHLPDSRIAPGNQLACTSGALFKIRSISRQELPSSDLLAEKRDGSHVWKATAQALMMITGRGKPDSVVDRTGRLVAQAKNDFFSHVNGGAAEHATRPRRYRFERVDYKLIRRALAHFQFSFS